MYKAHQQLREGCSGRGHVHEQYRISMEDEQCSEHTMHEHSAMNSMSYVL